jgi:methyl-accepting chemotaxis protein
VAVYNQFGYTQRSVREVKVLRERANNLIDRQKAGWRRLSVTMSLRMALTALVPVIVVAVVVAVSLSRSVRTLKAQVLAARQDMAQDTVGVALRTEAKAAMDGIDGYLRERIHDVIGWTNHWMLRTAAQDAAIEAEKLGLLSMTEAEVEEAMAGSRALDEDPELASYLQGLATRDPAFVELFFTDKYGFVVAYTNMPSDFVQVGEEWWDVAWEKGTHVGDVTYDSSAGVYAVDIAVRIEGDDGEPVGVLKALLDLRTPRDMAREAASQVADGVVHVFSQDGYQFDDSSGDSGHLDAMGKYWEVLQTVFEQPQGTDGYLLGQDDQTSQPIVIGFACSAPGSYYDIKEFDGFRWAVAVEQPEETAFALLQGLDHMVLQMDKVRTSIVRLILGIGVVAGIGAIVVALLSARLIVRPIVELAQASQRVAAGDFNAAVQAEQTNEIGQLQDAFFQMTMQLRRTLEDEREQREYLQAMIAEYMTFVASIARGDLATRLALDGEEWDDDPLLVLGHSLNEMADNLRGMTMRIKDVAQRLDLAASRISAVTTQQASGASEQSAAISQTTTTVDELKTIAEQSVARAQDVASASQRTVEVSRDGQRAVLDTIGGMTHIRSRVEGIAENILALSGQTQQIGDIIATVNDIAAQSNILALNASVEAARAGEYGKGFAVVAAEVRNLAEQSRQATAQVREILSDIQKATNATVMATEEGTKQVAEGVELASQARRAIEQLATVIEESTQASMQVVAGGRQQAAGVEQIAVAMQNINQVTVQGLSSTRQAEKAAQELGELAYSLTEIVEQYKL